MKANLSASPSLAAPKLAEDLITVSFSSTKRFTVGSGKEPPKVGSTVLCRAITSKPASSSNKLTKFLPTP